MKAAQLLKSFSLCALIASACTSELAYAGGSSSGQVTQVLVMSGDVVIFTAGPHSGKPSCSTVGDDWAFSLSTVTGIAMYKLILYAQSRGKQISVIGNTPGDCSAWGDREAPGYMWISQ